MSAEYMNLDQLIEELTELRSTGKYTEDVPVYCADSSGYDYYVKTVVIKDGSIVLN